MRDVDAGELQGLLDGMGVSVPGSVTLEAFQEIDVTGKGRVDLDHVCAAIFTPSSSGQRNNQTSHGQPATPASSATGKGPTVTDPSVLLARLEQKVSRNVSGVAQAYRHFRSFADKTGHISQGGFHAAVERLDIPASKACCQALFAELDVQSAGKVDLNDFMKGILHAAKDGQPSQTSAKTTSRSSRPGAGAGAGGGAAAVDSSSKSAAGQPRELMSKEKLAPYMAQLQDKFAQHSGGGRDAMLRAWSKLRIFASARVPSQVTFSEFDAGLKVCSCERVLRTRVHVCVRATVAPMVLRTASLVIISPPLVFRKASLVPRCT